MESTKAYEEFVKAAQVYKAAIRELGRATIAKQVADDENNSAITDSFAAKRALAEKQEAWMNGLPSSDADSA